MRHFIPTLAGAIPAALALLAPMPTRAAECPLAFGDVNQDANVTIVDVQCAILSALWSLGGTGDPPACTKGLPGLCDLDCAGELTVADVQLNITQVLGAALSPMIDSDQDGCPNTCEAAYCGDGKCQMAMGERCHTCSQDCGPCPGGACCTPLTIPCSDSSCTACVCALDAFCCATVWDAVCAEAAKYECTGACGCTPPPAGSCCQPRTTPTCNDSTCQTCVCSDDAYCCDTAWDAACVVSAEGWCTASCACSGEGGGP